MPETMQETLPIDPMEPEYVPVDYFSFMASEKFYFPDRKQYIEFQIMNEGAKSEFQKKTQKDLVVERQSGNARMRVNPATERHELIKASVTGWYMFRGGKEYPYSPRMLDDFLKLADPKIIEDLEKAIRKANPWLMSDMSVEDIDREIANLQEMREIAVEREAGEGSSSSK